MELLRTGLRSQNLTKKRGIILGIQFCKVDALRPDVEAILDSNAPDELRNAAAHRTPAVVVGGGHFTGHAQMTSGSELRYTIEAEHCASTLPTASRRSSTRPGAT